jgi:hypothetical protein
MNHFDLEDRRTERLWSIRLTAVCAVLIAGLFAIAVLTSTFPEPRSAAETAGSWLYQAATSSAH